MVRPTDAGAMSTGTCQGGRRTGNAASKSSSPAASNAFDRFQTRLRQEVAAPSRATMPASPANRASSLGHIRPRRRRILLAKSISPEVQIGVIIAPTRPSSSLSTRVSCWAITLLLISDRLRCWKSTAAREARESSDGAPECDATASLRGPWSTKSGSCGAAGSWLNSARRGIRLANPSSSSSTCAGKERVAGESTATDVSAVLKPQQDESILVARQQRLRRITGFAAAPHFDRRRRPNGRTVARVGIFLRQKWCRGGIHPPQGKSNAFFDRRLTP